MFKGGSAVYCPACQHRQTVGTTGAKVELPTTVTCEKCGATLQLTLSQTGGAHVTAVQGATAK